MSDDKNQPGVTPPPKRRRSLKAVPPAPVPDEPPSRGPGRPKADIDWKKAGKLFERQATIGDVAAFFDVSRETMERRCLSDLGMDIVDFKAQFRSKGRAKILNLLWDQAEQKKNTYVMLELARHFLKLTPNDAPYGSDEDAKANASNETVTVYETQWGGTAEQPTPKSPAEE